MDPAATVRFNHKVPDRDTGTLRQVDVWAEARVCNLFPAAVLISCKDHGRPLDIGSIETFEAEKRSTGATMGVIFSRTGFTEPALKKANSAGIVCCRLFRDEPLTLPDVLTFAFFHCRPKASIPVVTRRSELCTATTWDELLARRVGTSDDAGTVADLITAAYHYGEDKSFAERDPRRATLPAAWQATISLLEEPGVGVEIRISGSWVGYRAKVEAHLLNGSYCFTDSTFSGSLRSPAIDTQSTDPGSGWEVLEQDVEPPVNSGIVFGRHPNVMLTLRPHVTGKAITVEPQAAPPDDA
jgi:hypothetical protein